MRVFALMIPVLTLCFAPATGSMAAQEKESAPPRSVSGQVVELTTGINPDHYPCARDGILRLYEQRREVASLSSYHPKRLWVWLQDNLSYYSAKVIDFFKGLFSRDTLDRGIRGVQSLAQGGGISNPLSGMDNKVEGWLNDLSPRSQQALKEQVERVVQATTRSDGSCK